MPFDPESRRLRAKQVGMLMQAYRRAYEVDGKKGRLSQEGLLKLMGQVDPVYLERYNHSTVARWESGATRPTRERLEAFGGALQLTPAEIQGMVRLAGLHEDDEDRQTQDAAVHDPGQMAGQGAHVAGPDEDAREAGDSGFIYAGQVTRYVLTRFAVPGLAVAASGYILARLGWNAGWVMSLYVILAVFLVVFQGFLRMRRPHELREVYFITVFFLLSGNLLQAPAIRMDPYGFYTLTDFANTPIPYLLATLANMLIALIAGMMFDALWRWQYTSGRGFANGCYRAAWSAFPPLFFVYVCALLLFGMGTWIFLFLVFSVMGGVLMTVLVLRDREMTFDGWEKRLLLQVALGVILLLTALGGASILVVYMEPSPYAIPDHTILRSWDIDFETLGYPPDELLERYRVAVVLSSMSILLYMLLVLGGLLLTTINRLEITDSPDMQPDASFAVIAVEEASENGRRGPAADDRDLAPGTWLRPGRDSVHDILETKRDRD